MYVILLVVLYSFCVLPTVHCGEEEGARNESNKTDDPRSAGRQSSSAATGSVGTPPCPLAPTGGPLHRSKSPGQRPHASTQGAKKAHQQSPSDEADDLKVLYDDIVFSWLRAPQETTRRAGDLQKEIPSPGGASAGNEEFPYDDLRYNMHSQPWPLVAPEGAQGAEENSRSYEGASAGATGGDGDSLGLRVLLQGFPEEKTQGAEGSSGATSDAAGGSPFASASFGSPPPEASLEGLLDAVSSLREALLNADNFWIAHTKAADANTEKDLRAAEAALKTALVHLRVLMESRGIDTSRNPDSLENRGLDALERISQIWKEDPR